MPSEESADLCRCETAPAGAVGDVPRPFLAKEELELRAEYRENVIAERFEDSKDTLRVSRSNGPGLLQDESIA